jgi:hypothetical protein
MTWTIATVTLEQFGHACLVFAGVCAVVATFCWRKKV